MHKRDEMLIDFTIGKIREERGDLIAQAASVGLRELCVMTRDPDHDGLTDAEFIAQLEKEWPFFREYCIRSIE